ncbi:MAG: SMC-Scp complex subunit ScpB [Alphaproteobacteria bacterium]|jgi:segregation and condensation protein B|nr:SMC-Scp complex subunit ScpB [Alphaproteobacteria bacterium]
MSNEQNIRILEALLFASAQPVSTKDLHERMPEGADVGGALMELKAQYESRGINLIESDGHWAFRTAADLAGVLEIQREAQRKLSRAAMETLAIIAYHQPVTRPEIENIRGVATHRGTVDALMEMGWIKPGRRREAPGRPMTWVTTPEFLDQFSLENLTDLPGLEDLKASGLLDRRPAIEAIPTGNLFADEDELESLDGSDDDSEFESEPPSELEEEAA